MTREFIERFMTQRHLIYSPKKKAQEILGFSYKSIQIE